MSAAPRTPHPAPLETPLTRDAGVEVPIICGAMYPCSNPELVAAASAAGAIGIVQPVSMTYVHRHEYRDGLKLIRRLTDKPIGMNALIESSSRTYHERMVRFIDVSLEEGIRFFITSLGNPRWVVDRVAPAGGKVYHDVTERKWALKAREGGVHGLICVNSRAGGHAGPKTPQELIDECGDLGLPLVCAGGVGEPEEFVAALRLGYAGVQMGTRFIATTECNSRDDYKQAILNAKEEDIVLTERVTGVPIAVINTPYIQRIGTRIGPFSRWLFRQRRTKKWMRSFYALRSLYKMKHDSVTGSGTGEYWQAGRSVRGIDRIEPAGDIIRRFAEAATRAVVAVLLGWFAGAAQAQTLDERLQGRLDSLHRAGRFIGVSAGVVLPDGRVIALASGLSDSAARRPLRPDHRMLAGSVGKTFFAALAWRLAAEQRLPLDSPIARWLGNEPWFDSLPNARQITVRHLMNHSSGLVRYELNPRFLADLQAQPDRAYTPVEELRYLFGAPAAFAAGQGWDYSDTNYIVLAMILERIMGRRAYDEIRRLFLEPMQLGGTIPSERRDLPGLAQGYAGRNNPFGAFDAVLRADGRFALNPQFEWAGGGFASTGRDLARWAHALYTGGVVDTAFLNREVLQGVVAPMLGAGARYGLGVIIRQTPLGLSWGHSGFFPGYLTEMRWYPERRVAIAVMVNQNQPGRGPGGLISDLMAEIVR